MLNNFSFSDLRSFPLSFPVKLFLHASNHNIRKLYFTRNYDATIRSRPPISKPIFHLPLIEPTIKIPLLIKSLPGSDYSGTEIILQFISHTYYFSKEINLSPIFLAQIGSKSFLWTRERERDINKIVTRISHKPRG